MIFKFWLWKITFKANRLDADEKVGYLANELIKTLKASGRTIAHPEISEGFGSIDIIVHSLGENDEKVYIKNVTNGWSVTAKPTFKEF